MFMYFPSFKFSLVKLDLVSRVTVLFLKGTIDLLEYYAQQGQCIYRKTVGVPPWVANHAIIGKCFLFMIIVIAHRRLT